MAETYDCIVCGSCVLDILVRPVPLDRPLGEDALVRVAPIAVSPGGMVSNAAIALARLGRRAAAMTYVGDDEWGAMLRRCYEAEGVDAAHLATHPTVGTSVTAVLVDEAGRRSFLHCVGAPKQLDRAFFLERLDVFARSRYALFGYYPLMPRLLDDLAEVLAAIRARGCATALDAAGGGGTMQPLDRLLPHLDVYCPSRDEAVRQTGCHDPRQILETYRGCGAPGLLGVKLGAAGALLSPAAGAFVEIPPVVPPGPVVDTTGAGDTFFAGLLAGLMHGMSPYDAGRLAAACGACCVTALGGAAGIRGFAATAALAGVLRVA